MPNERTAAVKGIVVLGMHRSGTSAIVRVINLLGVPLVGASALLPPTEENPAGYWESAPLVEFNDSLLDVLNGTWSSPPVLGSKWTIPEDLLDKEKEARRLFEDQAPKDAWVWKDPRLCVLLPFWKTVIEQPLSAVIIYRHPLEVARSLTKRDGLTMQHGLCLWERYLRCSLEYATGMDTLVIRFERLLSDDGIQQQIVEFLQAQDVLGGSQVGTNPLLLDDFLKSDLRRVRVSEGSVKMGAELSDPQIRLFDMIESLQGTHDRFQPGELPEPSPWLNLVLMESRRADHLSHRLTDAEQELERLAFYDELLTRMAPEKSLRRRFLRILARSFIRKGEPKG